MKTTHFGAKSHFKSFRARLVSEVDVIQDGPFAGKKTSAIGRGVHCTLEPFPSLSYKVIFSVCLSRMRLEHPHFLSEDGRHAPFPLDTNSSEEPTCNFGSGSNTAKLLPHTRLIVWDECTMTYCKALKTVKDPSKTFATSTIPWAT
ncbi:ATP-dependent helicase [Elysia marginata]|uniref:ATP-dependent helicase n=1 Tax=Elysia marginata TaxID=1093978 RepID=A0AAV4HQJ7_9GAST|nr:ATP-dependent helicase [Elysia marginata]